MKNYLKIIEIDDYSITHKYLQICNSILRAIERHEIVQDDVLPSINDLSTALEVSRNTIERAYKELKKVGALDSIPGKGYFISNVNYNQQIKVLLLFNKLSSHKKIVYDAFVQRLGTHAAVDFYIYNNDFNFFKKLVAEKIAHYSKCVIVPHFYESEENAFEVINAIPKDKLILVDKLVQGVTGDFSAVYEDFEQDIYHALEELLQQLSKYHTLKIIFPEYSYHSKDIVAGFQKFCQQYAFEYDMISDIEHEAIKTGTAYINLMEDDLVKLIERIIAEKLKVGKDIGVISYNETPLKKIILDGITTISTDFKMLGEKAADLVLSDAKQHIPIPFKITLRNSL